MIKVFFDASVIFSGIYSEKGGSHRLLNLVKTKEIIGITSQTVIEELIDNVDKLPIKKNISQTIKDLNMIVIETITEDEIKLVSKIVDPKDAHVLAGAQLAVCQYLVTLDKKHINNSKVRNRTKPLKIVSPKKLLLFIPSKNR